MKGGYIIIDLKDVPITSGTGTTIKGIYERLENSYRKPVLIENLTLDTLEKRNTFVDVEVSESNFTFEAYGCTWVVTNEDLVTPTKKEG